MNAFKVSSGSCAFSALEEFFGNFFFYFMRKFFSSIKFSFKFFVLDMISTLTFTNLSRFYYKLLPSFFSLNKSSIFHFFLLSSTTEILLLVCLETFTLCKLFMLKTNFLGCFTSNFSSLN